MKEQKDLKGERVYDDLQIDGFADEEGLMEEVDR
jgi:hypothetical protein